MKFILAKNVYEIYFKIRNDEISPWQVQINLVLF